MLSFFYPYRFFEWKLQVAHRGSWKTKRIGAGFLQTPMCFAKSCDPNYPRNACKNPANARKSWFLVLEGIESFCKRCIFGNVWKENEFNRSHTHSVCLNLPIKQQGLQPRTEPLLWIDGFLMGQSRWPQHVSPKIALFYFMTSNRCVFLRTPRIFHAMEAWGIEGALKLGKKLSSRRSRLAGAGNKSLVCYAWVEVCYRLTWIAVSLLRVHACKSLPMVVLLVNQCFKKSRAIAPIPFFCPNSFFAGDLKRRL